MHGGAHGLHDLRREVVEAYHCEWAKMECGGRESGCDDGEKEGREKAGIYTRPCVGKFVSGRMEGGKLTCGR